MMAEELNENEIPDFDEQPDYDSESELNSVENSVAMENNDYDRYSITDHVVYDQAEKSCVREFPTLLASLGYHLLFTCFHLESPDELSTSCR